MLRVELMLDNHPAYLFLYNSIMLARSTHAPVTLVTAFSPADTLVSAIAFSPPIKRV